MMCPDWLKKSKKSQIIRTICTHEPQSISLTNECKKRKKKKNARRIYYFFGLIQTYRYASTPPIPKHNKMSKTFLNFFRLLQKLHNPS